MAKKLRIGIITKENVAPSWQNHIIEKLKESNFSEIVLILKIKNKKRKALNTPSMFWNLFLKMDDFLF